MCVYMYVCISLYICLYVHMTGHTRSEPKISLSKNARETKHTPSILRICRLQK